MDRSQSNFVRSIIGARSDQKSGSHMMATNNSNRVEMGKMLWPFLFGSSSFLQVRGVHVKSRMGSKFGQIRPRAAERLEKSP